MNRSRYFDFIEENLSVLAVRIEKRGKLNILDLNSHSENLYRELLNLLFDWHLKNMNAVKPNAEAIDLIDTRNKIIIQVSSTATKEKIESALKKDLSNKKGYAFKFISISKDAAKLRKGSYDNPNNLSFDPQSDIYDIGSFLKEVLYMGIERQKEIFDFIKKEFTDGDDLTKLDSNLTRIINILAQEDWNPTKSDYKKNEYQIYRKIEFNSLNIAIRSIEKHAIHHSRVDKIYREFDKSGVNKSSSVLASIGQMHLSNLSLQGDTLFFKIVELVIERIQTSANYSPIPFEELELCTNILVVDSFIRCEIFENPEGYVHAAT